MSWEAWGRGILTGLLGIALTALLTKLLGQRRKPTHAGRASGRMKYPRVFVVMGVFAALAGMASYINHSPNAFDQGPFVSVIVFIGLPVAGTLAATAYFRVWYALVPGGMRYQPMWRRQSSFTWSEVTRLQYQRAEHKKYFRIQHAGGRPVRIPLVMSGLSEFARVALAEAPAGSIDPETRGVLENAAAGYLPDDA